MTEKNKRINLKDIMENPDYIKMMQTADDVGGHLSDETRRRRFTI